LRLGMVVPLATGVSENDDYQRACGRRETPLQGTDSFGSLPLRKHLSILKRQGVIRDWYDREITAGTDWKGQLDQHLNSSGVILLLVSAAFLASDYCYDVEMTRALERHDQGEARVIPVILRMVDGWQLARFGKLQSLPTDGRPVTSWKICDEAFADVARAPERHWPARGSPDRAPAGPVSVRWPDPAAGFLS